MERNTYATSLYISVPIEDARRYLAKGDSLTEYTLFSRMQEQVDQVTWLGTASGYQAGLYYHVRERDVGAIGIVEWHCGAELGKYYHVYPMLLFRPDYFGSSEDGTYYHWISFVDPARTTPMIEQGLPTVHRAEARSLKAQLERRRGHRQPAHGALDLRSHTIYVEALIESGIEYLGDPATVDEWGYMFRRDGAALFDEYDRPIEVELTTHRLGEYVVIEHDTKYLDSGAVVRTPMVLIPAAYAFAQPDAAGFILHRITAWPVSSRREDGKQSLDDYNAEAINTKRILEGRAGNLDAYARGCSFVTSARR